jgi:hypothetical protein
MKNPDRVEFLSWSIEQLNARWKLGDERYNSSETGFRGDPLDHAIEEALDLVVYLWVEKRKREIALNG